MIRMLVDIAIRALSPAVNDPTTAVQSLDRIKTLLMDLHRRSPGPTVVLDRAGAARGPDPGADLVGLHGDRVLTENRHYGAGSVQVARRLYGRSTTVCSIGPTGDARRRLELERRLPSTMPSPSPLRDDEERAPLRPDVSGLGGRRAQAEAAAPTEAAGA